MGSTSTKLSTLLAVHKCLFSAELTIFAVYVIFL